MPRLEALEAELKGILKRLSKGSVREEPEGD
jgi:hypothetical protein